MSAHLEARSQRKSPWSPMYVSIGKLMRSLRVKKNLSQNKVAKALGINRAQLMNRENGIHKISVDEIAQIAAFFEMKPHNFMFDIWNEYLSDAPEREQKSGK